jgi:hypothetical protein
MTYEIYKPNGIWVSNKKYPNQSEAEAVALQKSHDSKGEMYGVREVGGETVALFEDGRKFEAVAA